MGSVVRERELFNYLVVRYNLTLPRSSLVAATHDVLFTLRSTRVICLLKRMNRLAVGLCLGGWYDRKAVEVAEGVGVWNGRRTKAEREIIFVRRWLKYRLSFGNENGWSLNEI